jgi:hypothetical protein
MPGMVAHACNPRTQEAKAGESWIQDQSGLYSKFEDSLGCIVRPCLKKKKQQNVPIW